jgi:capsular exopolysaccharide synthesis family protein
MGMIYDDERNEDFRDIKAYWWTIRRRLWLIILITVVFGVSAYLHSAGKRPLYSATTKVLIQRFNPMVVKVDEVMPTDAWSNDYYQTQYEILKSRSLARDVIKELRLYEHPEFNSSPKKGFSPFELPSAVASVVHTIVSYARGSNGDSQDKIKINDDEIDPLSPYINAYLGRLKIIPVKNSRLAKITFVGHDPELVAKVANTHARAYINKTLEMKLSATQDAIAWLDKRLKELKYNLKKSEEALQLFQQKEDIVSLRTILTAGDGSGNENLVVQKLVELNTKLTEARARRIELETLYRQLKGLSSDARAAETIPYVVQSPLVQKIKADLIELNRQYTELQGKYGERHPRMVSLRKEMRGLRRKLSAEVLKIAKSVEIQYKMALAREKGLENALLQAKKEIMDLNKKAIQYGVLQREVETNRQIYDMILKRAKETSLTSGLKSTNIFIVDRAEMPSVPFAPRVKRSVIMACLAGLGVGLLLVFLMEYLDTAIHTPEDVKRHFEVPFLGPIGLVKSKRDSVNSELVVLDEPRSSFTESIRSLRTGIRFSLTEKHENSILVTSPGPLEGKTFISCNLAISLAKMGRRVLLVDGDMRRPRIHSIFGISSRPGLSNLLVRKCTLEDAVRETHVKLLHILPAGRIPPNPAELLSSRRMAKIVEILKKTFDFVVFDSPPVLSVTDAVVLGGYVDGIVMILKASETKREEVQRALDSILDTSGKIMGVVLNQVDFKGDPYYYRYYYKYYNHYAETKKRKGSDSAASMWKILSI